VQVSLKTSLGDIDIELWPKEAPKVRLLGGRVGGQGGTQSTSVGGWVGGRHLCLSTSQQLESAQPELAALQSPIKKLTAFRAEAASAMCLCCRAGNRCCGCCACACPRLCATLSS
jgi:hypothetical protein